MRRNLGARLKEQSDPLVFNNSKYATRNVIGSEKIINNFIPEELRAYYNDFHCPDLQAVIVVGDIDAAKIETEIQHLSIPSRNERTSNPDWYTEIPDNSEPFYTKVFDKEKTESSSRCSNGYARHRLPR